MYYSGSYNYNYWPRNIPRIIPIPITSISSDKPVKSSDDLKKILLEHIDTKFAALSSSMPKDGTINIEQLRRELKDSFKVEMGTFIKEKCVDKDFHKKEIKRMEDAFQAQFTKAFDTLMGMINGHSDELTGLNTTIQATNTQLDTYKTENDLFRNSITGIVTGLQNRITASGIDTVRADIAENMRTQIDQLKIDFANTHISKTDFQNQIQLLDAKLTTHVETLRKQFVSDLTLMGGRINRLILSFAEITPKLDAQNENIRTINQNMDMLKTKFEGITREFNEYKQINSDILLQLDEIKMLEDDLSKSLESFNTSNLQRFDRIDRTTSRIDRDNLDKYKQISELKELINVLEEDHNRVVGLLNKVSSTAEQNRKGILDQNQAFRGFINEAGTKMETLYNLISSLSSSQDASNNKYDGILDNLLSMLQKLLTSELRFNSVINYIFSRLKIIENYIRTGQIDMAIEEENNISLNTLDAKKIINEAEQERLKVEQLLSNMQDTQDAQTSLDTQASQQASQQAAQKAQIKVQQAERKVAAAKAKADAAEAEIKRIRQSKKITKAKRAEAEKLKQAAIAKAQEDIQAELASIIISDTDTDININAVKQRHKILLDNINYIKTGLDNIPEGKRTKDVDEFKKHLQTLHTFLLNSRKQFDASPTAETKDIFINETNKIMERLRKLNEDYNRQILNIGRRTKEKYEIYLSETSEE